MVSIPTLLLHTGSILLTVALTFLGIAGVESVALPAAVGALLLLVLL